MNKIRVIIADDELPALNLLASYVNQMPILQLVAKCNNASEVLQELSHENVDLIFLDIQMPGMNGIELSKRISPRLGVVFTTAFTNYAIDGFQVEAIDYLLKPFDFEEFSRAVKKAQKRVNIVNTASETDSFFVKVDYRFENIKYDNLLFAESDKDYVKLFIENKIVPLSSLLNLKDLQEQLPSEKFMRIHRSFIINLNKIESIERNQVIINTHRITIADSYRAEFQKYLQKHTL